MRRILIIIFLLFTCFAFVCCESKKERYLRHEAEQQRRDERFEKINKENRQRQIIDMRTTRAGRYEIFQHQQFAKNTFLLDTMDGRIWIIVEDKETKELLWQEIKVENRDIPNIEELFKNEK